MKKTITIIAAYLILIVFCMAPAAGCGKNHQEIKENTQETQTQEAGETENAVQIGKGTTVAPTPVPPGTDPDPETVPKADQTDVGKTVVLKLGDEAPLFCYTYNSQTSQERLTVMSDSDPDNGTARITVYSVKLGGISGLAEAIGQELDCTVISVTNISFYESQYFNSVCNAGLKAPDSTETVDLAAPAVNPNTEQFYISIFSTTIDEPLTFAGIRGNQNSTVSESLATAESVIERLGSRYGFEYKG